MKIGKYGRERHKAYMDWRSFQPWGVKKSLAYSFDQFKAGCGCADVGLPLVGNEFPAFVAGHRYRLGLPMDSQGARTGDAPVLPWERKTAWQVQQGGAPVLPWDQKKPQPVQVRDTYDDDTPRIPKQFQQTQMKTTLNLQQIQLNTRPLRGFLPGDFVQLLASGTGPTIYQSTLVAASGAYSRGIVAHQDYKDNETTILVVCPDRGLTPFSLPSNTAVVPLRLVNAGEINFKLELA